MRIYRKLFSVIIISIVFCCGSPLKTNFKLNTFTNKNFEGFELNNSQNSYTTIEDIIIFTDSEFENYSFSGNGSKNNPYIIENYNVSPLMDWYNAIEIAFTTSYFVIRNCLISSANTGILIGEIANGTCTIENNVFTNTDVCIQISESDGIIIEGNIGYNNKNGLNIDESDATKITRNRFSNNRSSSVDGYQGLFFYRLRNSFVEHNIFENYNISIFGVSSVFNNFINNTCTNSSITNAFLLDYCFCSNIVGNFIQNSSGVGLKLDGASSGNIISHNSIINCTSYGIQIEDSECRNNTIHHNNLLDNNLLGTCQGYDNGLQNNWYCSTEQEGNYWLDWVGIGNYLIDGTSSNEDVYPLDDEVSVDLSLLEIQSLSLEVDDSYEENDFFYSSALIDSRNETYHLMGWDADWFTIYLKSYQILTLNVTAIGDGLNTQAALHQEGSAWVLELSDSIGRSEIIVYTSIVNDFYNIELEFYSISSISPNYTMTITISDDPTYRDEYEDNDSIEEAKTIEVENNSYDLIYNDKDYFNVSLTAGFKFTAEITFNNILIDLELFLLSYGDDKEEWIVARSTTQEEFERIEYIVVTTKNYYLLITSTDPDGIGIIIPVDYTLTVQHKINRGVPVIVLLPLLFTMIYFTYRRKRDKLTVVNN